MPKQLEEFSEKELVRMICDDVNARDMALHYIFANSGWHRKALINLRLRGYS